MASAYKAGATGAARKKMSMSKLSHEDQQMIEKQSFRLFNAAPWLFADVMNKNLKEENERLKLERDGLVELIERKEMEVKKTLAMSLGNMVISEGIMGYNSGADGLMCNCLYCCRLFNAPPAQMNHKMKCKVWKQVVGFMRLAEVTYSFLWTYNGTKVLHPPMPETFPPPSMYFEDEPISHLPYHLVFEQRGNPYDFAYGTRLTGCSTPIDKEIKQLDEFLQMLREDSLLGGVSI
jgi:hypothetical protein